MDTQHRTQMPPPPQATKPPAEPDRGTWAPVILMLLGLGAWGAGFALWAAAEDADVPTKNYAMTVALAVVGAALLIIAVLYELASRMTR